MNLLETIDKVVTTHENPYAIIRLNTDLSDLKFATVGKDGTFKENCFVINDKGILLDNYAIHSYSKIAMKLPALSSDIDTKKVLDTLTYLQHSLKLMVGDIVLLDCGGVLRFFQISLLSFDSIELFRVKQNTTKENKVPSNDVMCVYNAMYKLSDEIDFMDLQLYISLLETAKQHGVKYNSFKESYELFRKKLNGEENDDNAAEKKLIDLFGSILEEVSMKSILDIVEDSLDTARAQSKKDEDGRADFLEELYSSFLRKCN